MSYLKRSKPINYKLSSLKLKKATEMKKLPLSNPNFRYLEQSFAEWLDILGYAPTTVYGLPIHVRELLVYLEQQEIKNINQLETYHINDYYKKLSIRSNNIKELLNIIDLLNIHNIQYVIENDDINLII
jgi:hypothetical protein